MALQIQVLPHCKITVGTEVEEVTVVELIRTQRYRSVILGGGVPNTNSNNFFLSFSFFSKTCNFEVLLPQLTQACLRAVSSSTFNS